MTCREQEEDLAPDEGSGVLCRCGHLLTDTDLHFCGYCGSPIQVTRGRRQAPAAVVSGRRAALAALASGRTAVPAAPVPTAPLHAAEVPAAGVPEAEPATDRFAAPPARTPAPPRPVASAALVWPGPPGEQAARTAVDPSPSAGDEPRVVSTAATTGHGSHGPTADPAGPVPTTSAALAGAALATAAGAAADAGPAVSATSATRTARAARAARTATRGNRQARVARGVGTTTAAGGAAAPSEAPAATPAPAAAPAPAATAAPASTRAAAPAAPPASIAVAARAGGPEARPAERAAAPGAAAGPAPAHPQVGAPTAAPRGDEPVPAEPGTDPSARDEPRPPAAPPTSVLGRRTWPAWLAVLVPVGACAIRTALGLQFTYPGYLSWLPIVLVSAVALLKVARFSIGLVGVATAAVTAWWAVDHLVSTAWLQSLGYDVGQSTISVPLLVAALGSVPLAAVLCALVDGHVRSAVRSWVVPSGGPSTVRAAAVVLAVLAALFPVARSASTEPGFAVLTAPRDQIRYPGYPTPGEIADRMHAMSVSKGRPVSMTCTYAPSDGSSNPSYQCVGVSQVGSEAAQVHDGIRSTALPDGSYTCVDFTSGVDRRLC